MSSDFNERSHDAMFARIITELESVHIVLKEMRDESREDKEKITKRVSSLEHEKWYQRGVVAAVSVVAVAAWEAITKK